MNYHHLMHLIFYLEEIDVHIQRKQKPHRGLHACVHEMHCELL